MAGYKKQLHNLNLTCGLPVLLISMKKIWHFKYLNWLHCNQNSQILAKKSISQYGYLKHSKWAVLRNLSIISIIIMRIGEKKLGCLNTKKLWIAPMLSYWKNLFLAKIWLCWLQQGKFQYLKCHTPPTLYLSLSPHYENNPWFNYGLFLSSVQVPQSAQCTMVYFGTILQIVCLSLCGPTFCGL